MSIIDRQRITAVATLQALGYTYSLFSGWTMPTHAGACPCTTESDALHAILIRRADALAGSTEGSPEEDELKRIADALLSYEAKRWLEGKVCGGKG